MRRNPAGRPREASGLRFARLGMIAICAGVLTAAAEKPSANSVKDFSVPEYYDPPHERQMKSLLQGAQAEQQPGGLIWITDVKLQTFNETGEPQMLVQAPHCILDPIQKAVSSNGPLSVKSVNGQFYLEGEGFLWQPTNSNLTISNRVRTVLHNSSNLSIKP